MADPDTPDSPDSDEAPGEFDATQRPCSADNRGGKTMEVKTSSYQALLTLSRVSFSWHSLMIWARLFKTNDVVS